MSRVICLAIGMMCVLSGGIAMAAIESISASADVSVTEFVDETQSASVSGSGVYPSSETLPLQVVGERLSMDEHAAGISAVQFADPASVDTSNPQEFAVNLALTSESETTRYDASGRLIETRRIVFSPGEIAGTLDGDTLQLVGTLFLDGTMSLLTADAERDISDAFTELTLTVEKHSLSDPNLEPEKLFSGGVLFTGTSDGGASAEATGDFPSGGLLVTDLSLILAEFDGATVLILPQIEIDYDYSATVGEAFELVATLEVSAANLPGETAALILLGLPLEQLSSVIGQVQSTLSARELIDALEAKRLNPEGTPAITAQPTTTPGLCGTLGFSSLLGLATMTWRCRRR
jgi:hypothetical protein